MSDAACDDAVDADDDDCSLVDCSANCNGASASPAADKSPTFVTVASNEPDEAPCGISVS